MNSEPLVKVYNLKTHFSLNKAHPFSAQQTVYAVDGVSFEIKRGKTFGLVGESGCGKSTIAKSILRLVEPTSGSVMLGNTDIRALNVKELRQFRRHMQIVFQDPYSSMNPRNTAGQLIRTPLKILKLGSETDQRKRVEKLLKLVGLRPEQCNLFPHQFSGGQRQRICVARALAPSPDFIVCDEPVSALDVAIQAQILNLLVKLQQELNLTYLFISHDMAVVQHLCDEIGVMYLGKIVEKADRRSLFTDVRHPYTKALLSAVPTVNQYLRKKTKHLEGDVPSPINPPPGCNFHPRCPLATDICRQREPLLRNIGNDHLVACHHV